MICTNAIGVDVVGTPVLTETSITATVVNAPMREDPAVKAERPVEKVYNLERARWYAIAMLRQIGKHQAVGERPEERERSYSQTHVKPLTEIRKGKLRDIGVDDLVQEGALVFLRRQKGKRKDGKPYKPCSTRAAVRYAFLTAMERIDPLEARDSRRKWNSRVKHGTVKRVASAFEEAIDDKSKLYIPECRKESQRKVCEYLGMGYTRKTIAKYMGVSRQYVEKLIREIANEFKREEFYPPSATIPQGQAERPFNNHYRPYIRQYRPCDRLDVPSHRDTRSEVPAVPTANGLYHSLSMPSVPCSYAVACVMA